MASGSICGPSGYRCMRYCKYCGKKKRHVVYEQPYYASIYSCFGCGRTWDYERGWTNLKDRPRKENFNKLESQWAQLPKRLTVKELYQW